MPGIAVRQAARQGSTTDRAVLKPCWELVGAGALEVVDGTAVLDRELVAAGETGVVVAWPGVYRRWNRQTGNNPAVVAVAGTGEQQQGEPALLLDMAGAEQRNGDQ